MAVEDLESVNGLRDSGPFLGGPSPQSPYQEGSSGLQAPASSDPEKANCSVAIAGASKT